MEVELYFNAQTVDAAIGQLPSEYWCNLKKPAMLSVEDIRSFLVPPAPKGRRNPLDPKAIELFAGVGHESDPLDPKQASIGHAGKIRALLCLRPLFSDRNVCGSKDLAASILGSATLKEAIQLNVLLSPVVQARQHDQREVWLDPDPKKTAFRMLERVQKFVARQLAAGGQLKHYDTDAIDQVLHKVVGRRHATPQDCARALIQELELSDHPRVRRDSPRPLSWLEGNIEQYVYDNSSETKGEDAEISSAIGSIISRLGYNRSQNPDQRSLVLQGPEESGKKSIVGDLLSGLRDKNGHDVHFKIMQRTGKLEDVPVLTISLRQRDYRSLAQHVLAFLLRQKAVTLPLGAMPESTDPRVSARKEFEDVLERVQRQFPDTVPLTNLLDAIKEAHENRPSLFIFLDADDMARGSMSRILHQRGMYRLLRSLRESCTESRFLITASDRLDSIAARSWAMPRLHVGMPPLSRLSWYADSTIGKVLISKIVNELTHNSRREVPGDMLALFAAMADLGADGTELLELIKSCLAKLPEVWKESDPELPIRIGQPADQDRKAPRERDHPDYAAASMEAYSAFMGFVQARGCLPALALVAAAKYSQDLLMDGSLVNMHERLTRNMSLDGVPHPLLRDELGLFVRAAKSMILRRVEPVIRDWEELGIDETEYGTNTATPEVRADSVAWSWEMSRTAAIWLLRAMYNSPDHAELGRRANREIARGARRRAQNKRIRKVRPASDLGRHEIARDIQCLEALLASLPPSFSGESKIANGTQRLKSDEVFSTSSDFKPQTAFAFAYHMLLREDIDARHQLSMRFDFDTTRLRAYLLLLCPLGQLQTWSVDVLRTMDGTERIGLPEKAHNGAPEKVLEDIIRVIGLVETASLLLTVSISAFHSQMPPVVDWVARHFPDLRDLLKEGGSGVVDIYARHVATVLDVSIQLGQPKLKTIAASTLDEVLAAAKNYKADFSQVLLRNGTADKRILRAACRIALRQAELTWMTHEDPERAIAMFEALERDDTSVSVNGLQDSAILTSGRSGRRYARFLVRDFPIAVLPPEPDGIKLRIGLTAGQIREAESTLRFIVETNLSRLNHNAGMDRIGVIADLVRLHALRGFFPDQGEPNLAQAERYMELMTEQEKGASISDGAALELSTLRAGMHLLAAWIDKTEKRVRRLDLAAEELEAALRTADELNCSPANVDILVLKARYEIAMAGAKRDQRDSHLARAMETLAKVEADATTLGYRVALPGIRSWRAWAVQQRAALPI